MEEQKYVIGTDGKPILSKPLFIPPRQTPTQSTYVPDHPACVPGKFAYHHRNIIKGTD